MTRSDDNDNNCFCDCYCDCMLVYVLTFLNLEYLLREEHFS